MSSRSARCTRPAAPASLLVAVVVGLLGALGAGTPALAAGRHVVAEGALGPVAATAAVPDLTLVDQSPWVVPGGAFDIQVALGPGVTTTEPLSLDLTLYNPLSARSEFDETLSGTPVGGVLDRAGPFALATGDRRPVLSVPIAEGTPTNSGPALSLSCTPGSCSGLYPIEVTLFRSADTEIAHLLTYLTFSEAPAGQPLRTALVLPLSVPVTTTTPGTTDAGSVVPPARADTAALSDTIDALRAEPSVALTLAPGARTVQALEAPGRASAPDVVRDLAALAATPAAGGAPGSEDQVLTGTYVPASAQQLVASGLTGELANQAARARAILDDAHVANDSSTYVVQGGLVGDALAGALPLLGATQVVVPAGAVAGSAETTFTQPFTLAVGPGAGVSAAAADPGLTAHFAAEPDDPVLAANQLLADLELIYFDLPNPVDPRGVVAVPPAGWSPDPAFVSTVLHGLAGNPDLDPVTLATYFATVPAGANHIATVQQPVASGTGPALATSVARGVTASRIRLLGFSSAVRGASPVETELDDGLLAAESQGLTTGGQLRALAAGSQALDLQLSQFQLSSERAITLTASAGAIPVTIISTAAYPIHAVVTFSSDKFSFPRGDTRAVYVDRPTTPVSVQAIARTSGSDLGVSVVLSSPDQGLVIAQGQLTVRSTATSIVGVLLTALALAVLVTWWARTWWSGRRRRAAHGARAS